MFVGLALVVRPATIVVATATVVVATAAADDGLVVRAEGRAREEPILTLDPVIQSRLEGLAVEQHVEQAQFQVGKTRVMVESIASDNVDTPWRVATDVPSRSWRTVARFSRDLGFAQLVATGSLGEVQTRYGSGAYYDLGLSLVRSKRFSRWVTAWVALSLGTRTWLGDAPPPGEARSSTQLTLSVGGTFR